MSIKDGWFSETEVLWPGQKFSLEVSSVSCSMCCSRLFFYAHIQRSQARHVLSLKVRTLNELLDGYITC